MKRRPTRILVAAAIRDAAGTNARPGAVAIRDGRIVAAGEAEAVLNDKALDPSAVRGMPGVCLLPALVNAHAHLELTLLGPRPYDAAGGFPGWVDRLRAESAGLDKEISAATGAEVSMESGVCAVGDIASSVEVIDAVRQTGLAGVSYLELFGVGEPIDEPWLAMIAAGDSFGLQPHAPYSTGRRVYEAATASGRPVCTHLAEWLEEHKFVHDTGGPFGEYLRRMVEWRDQFAEQYGESSSVQWMRPYLEARAAGSGGPWLLAHCNYVSDEDMKLLADTGASVAYCPIASDYFGHSGHRYREMLEAGINVCLGTDSIVCQPADEPQPLGILPQMRYLHERDRVDPEVLLKMATVNGAKALGLPADYATLLPGAPAHVLAAPVNAQDETDVLKQVLRAGAGVEAVVV